MTVKLQVALDIPQGDRAIQIAREAIAGGADWIEAGTPLIKSEGLEIVRRLRQEFPENVIVADMKTMDVGALEAEMAAKLGADIVVVMGVASDSTVSEAVEAAKKFGAEVMVDMMAVDDPVRRAKEVAALGASHACLHIAIDDQMRGISVSSLAELIPKLPMSLAIAGGIEVKSAAELAKSGAEIIIVGGAITKSADVISAAKAIRKAIDAGVVESTHQFKRYGPEELSETFFRVSTDNICDAQQRRGALRGIISRNGKGVKMVGRALTVQTVSGDWAKPVEAIDVASAGDVIVVDAGGGDIAVWGELASRSADNRGISGIVVDGAIRDFEEIMELGFPCFSRHIVPNAGEPEGFGGIGIQIFCGGVKIKPGDWVIGDSDGVVVVPSEKAVEVANRALDILERENRLREEIRRGGTLSEVLELRKWEKV